MDDEAWQQFMAGHLDDLDRRNRRQAFLAGLRGERAALEARMQATAVQFTEDLRRALRDTR